MKRTLCLVLALVGISAGLRAQDRDVSFERSYNPTLRILQSYTLKAGEEAHAIVVIGGDATIEGHVDRDVVVIAGRAQLAATALVDGSFVVVGGTAAIAEGAQVGEDVVVIGSLDAPPTFTPRGQHVVIGGSLLGHLRSVVPWLTGGLLLARPIVPGLPWVWTVAAVFFLINLLLNLVFETPVRAATIAMRDRPLSAFMTGLLVLLLVGPLCVVLAISVIGVVVIPFVLCALLLATVIGKVGFARWIGMSVVTQSDMENRSQSLRSFLIGSAIMCVVYIIPVLGFVTWATGAVFGLGAATQAALTAYRRENPKTPRQKPQPAATPVAAAPVAAAAAGVDVAPQRDSVAVPAEGVAMDLPPGGGSQAAPRSALLSFPHAPFLQRLAAFALDLVLVALAAEIIRLDRVFADGNSFGGNLLLLALIYHVSFWVWRQTTVGGIICQLRLTRVDGAPLEFAEALVRGLSGIFSLAVLGLGFLWILRDPERQAWHDRIAGTYVVAVPRGWPI